MHAKDVHEAGKRTALVFRSDRSGSYYYSSGRRFWTMGRWRQASDRGSDRRWICRQAARPTMTPADPRAAPRHFYRPAEDRKPLRSWRVTARSASCVPRLPVVSQLEASVVVSASTGIAARAIHHRLREQRMIFMTFHWAKRHQIHY